MFGLGFGAEESSYNLQLQWQLNGLDLPDETGAMLVLTNVTREVQGEYRAIVRAMDPGGSLITRTSSVAQLFVREALKPTLSIRQESAHDGLISLSMSGEPGRAYWLRRSTDITVNSQAWLPASASVLPIRISASGTRQFFDVLVFEPENAICHLNLKIIHWAKERLAADQKKRPGEAIAEVELNQYFQGLLLKCPEEGIYTYGPCEINPTCTLVRHFLVQ